MVGWGMCRSWFQVIAPDPRKILLSRCAANVSPATAVRGVTISHLSDSFFPPVFLRFGVGILHSIENATQFVHGTPRLAASHRT